MKGLGESIDLSTCVSAAKLKITLGLYLFKIFKTFFLFPISDLINLYFFLSIFLRLYKFDE